MQVNKAPAKIKYAKILNKVRLKEKSFSIRTKGIPIIAEEIIEIRIAVY
jgi:hypothetical protein